MKDIEVGLVYIVKYKRGERSARVLAVFPRVVDVRILGNNFYVTISREDVIKKAD